MEPIAIVGLGCVLPGAFNPRDYWRNLQAGTVSLIDVPEHRWKHALYHAEDRAVPDKTYARRCGFVEGFQIDWRKYKIPPVDVETVNPLQWMVLDAGEQALASLRSIPRDSTAVIIGSTGLGWQRDSGLRIHLDGMLDEVRASPAFQALPAAEREAVLEATRRELLGRLKEVSEDNVVGASASVAAGRINMHFDLKGPHCAVDAGFASSLAALDLAVRGLRDREFDLALAGGASEWLTPLEMIAFSKLGALASSEVRPFDSAADGTLLGEGAVLFALRRLDDALAADDTVYAVLRGIGGSSDGRGKSLVAPRTEGQMLAMQRALDDAGDVAPASIGYIECHATGTPLGDSSEVRALASVYRSAAPGSIALGSVKANIGHLRSAAGAAGLLKAVLSLHHRRIAPMPGFGTPNPRLELASTPFHVARAESNYPPGQLPRAAVSAFSFGGNNFHAVLEAFDPPSAPRLAGSGRRRFEHEPLAIIGLGCAFPGAEDVPRFWERLQEGYDRTQEVPADRYAIDDFHDADRSRKEKSYTRLGCFLDRLPQPTPAMRIPPAAWPAIDPSHVLCLATAEGALRDAAYQPGRWDNDRVAIALGFLPYQGKKFLADCRVNWNEFRDSLERALAARGLGSEARLAIAEQAEAAYKRDLPAITEDTLTGYLGSLNAGRISWLHDFHGPHYVVDAACASSHAALHAAWKLLSHRQADVVISGGVWCDTRPEFLVAACRFNALSAHGSFPFDARADGFIPGEGAGIVVLKRLADAERDGDRIRAVLRSVQGSSDGQGRSVLAPSRAGEGLAMQRALQAAGVAAASVDYIECHGTGTALGDVVEANAVGDVYGAGRPEPIAIGSVKSNIGHLNAAAGIAGIVKASLAVQAGLIPASIKCELPNPKMPATVQVLREQRVWASGPEGGPRRAGVSSFGVGGANFHAIVEEYRGAIRAPAATNVLLKFAASSVAGALDRLDEHLAAVQRGEAALSACGEATMDAFGDGAGPSRLALTARSHEDAERKAHLIRRTLASGGSTAFLEQIGVFIGEPASPLRRAPVALMFPGQGGQYANMLRELAAAWPLVQQTLDEADRCYQSIAGRSLTGSFFSDDPARFEQRDEDAHAAVFVVNVALARLMASLGIAPSLLIGQSAGELSALVVARSLSFEQGLAAVHARTWAVLSLATPDPGVMLALACSSSEVPALLQALPGFAALAADNGPKACIVSADAPGSRALASRCAERGIECVALAVSHGYHSQLIAEACPAYRQALEGLRFEAPQLPLLSTIDARPYATRPPAAFPEFLASQFVQPVLLRQALLLAHQQGARVFLEAGPKWSLTQFARETLGDLPHGAMASIHPKVGELEQFHRLLAFCFVHELGAAAPVPDPGDGMGVSSVDGVGAAERELMQLPLAAVLDAGTARAVAAALSARCGVDPGAMPEQALASLETIVAWIEGGNRTMQTPSLEDEVRRVLLGHMVAKTGYPEEMLTDDLDLEADLGIDTVKQVEIFAKTREHFQVPRDPDLALRDFNTLRKVVVHIAERAAAWRAGHPPAGGGALPQASSAPQGPVALLAVPSAALQSRQAPAAAFQVQPTQAAAAAVQAAPAAASAVQAALVGHMMAKTGYPEDMLGLDLDLEADLGIDTVKQVEIFAKTREQFGLPQDPDFALRDFNTLGKFIAYLVARLPAVAAPTAAPATPAASLPMAAAAASPVPEPARPMPPGPASVQSILLSMDFAELGLKPAERQRLAEALASRLGVRPPNAGGIGTLAELVRAVDAGGRAS